MRTKILSFIKGEKAGNIFLNVNVWLVLIFFCCAIIFLPIALEAIIWPYFVYENAWDEATYLSYQGAVANSQIGLRWVSASLVLFLHSAGLSGAQQNLLFDVTTIGGFLAAVVFISRRLGISNGARQARLAIFGTFGTSLFNQSNPLLANSFPNLRQTDTIWAVAYEGFLPILRTPEPQLSVLLSILALVAYFSFGRRWWLLLLPCPFLYFPVFIPYVFCTGVYIVFLWFAVFQSLVDKVVVRVVLANFVMILVLSALMLILGLSGAIDHGVAKNLVRFWHGTRVSPLLIWSVGSLGLAWLLVRKRLPEPTQTAWFGASITVVMLQAFIVSQPVLSGVEIHPLGLQAVAGTLGAAFALCLLIEALWVAASLKETARVAIYTTFAFAIGVFICLGRVNGAKAGLALILPGLNAQNYQRVKEAPLYTIVPGYLGGWIALAEPQMLATPLAYQYSYIWFMEACSEAIEANKMALEFFRGNRLDPDLVPWLKSLDAAEIVTRKVIANTAPQKGDPCSAASFGKHTVRTVPVNDVPVPWLRDMLMRLR